MSACSPTCPLLPLSPDPHIQKLSSSVLVRGTWHHSRSIAILPVCLSDCHCVCFQYFHAVSQHAATADRLFCTRIIVQATATDTHTTPCAEEPSFLLLLFVLLFIFSSAVLTPIINPTEAPTPGQAYPTRGLLHSPPREAIWSNCRRHRLRRSKRNSILLEASCLTMLPTKPNPLVRSLPSSLPRADHRPAVAWRQHRHSLTHAPSTRCCLLALHCPHSCCPCHSYRSRPPVRTRM